MYKRPLNSHFHGKILSYRDVTKNKEDEYQSPSASPPNNHSYMNSHMVTDGDQVKSSFIDSNEHADESESPLNSVNVLQHETSVGIRVESPETTVKEIEADKQEAQHVIGKYGIDPVEMLHLVERWTQTLLAEFYSLRFAFKNDLREKWERAELNINASHRRRKKELYEHIHALKKAYDTDLSREPFDHLRSCVSKIDQHANPTELKTKVSSTIEIYRTILHSLESIEKYQKQVDDSSFTPAKSVLGRIQALNQKASHSICIIGLEKCGKSTFVNALLGFELLPAASERCTQIRTVLKPTLSEDAALFAKVEFYDNNTFQKLVEKMVPKSDEESQTFETRKKKVRQEQKRLLDKFPKHEEMFKINDNLRNAEEQRQEIIKTLHKYIADEVYVNIIQEIAIYTDKLPGKNYEISDVPGFDSPIKEHRDAGLQAIRSADAFLFLTDGTRPSLTRDQIRLLNEIQDGKQHYEAMKRAFGVITKLDQCHTREKYIEHLTKSRNELVSKGFKENHIFAVCSITNLLKQTSEEYQNIVRKIGNFDSLQVGFKSCQDTLNQFIEYELPKTHLNQLIEFGSTKLTRYVNECLNNIRKDPSLSPMLSSNEGSDRHMKHQDDQEWDKVYHEQLFQPTFERANIWQKQVLIEERSQFNTKIINFFHSNFMESTKEFIDSPVNVKERMMSRYTFTVLHMTSQPVDDQLREELSFKLESIVLQTVDKLTRYLYDEYVSQLETLLNKVSLEENDNIYQSQKLTYEICLYELRAIVLRTCRPIITATLRYSHSDPACRRSAINELILIAPTIACHLCEGNQNDTKTTLTNQITSWTPTLKKGIEMALDVYGKTGLQNKIASTIFQFAVKKIL